MWRFSHVSVLNQPFVGSLEYQHWVNFVWNYPSLYGTYFKCQKEM